MFVHTACCIVISVLIVAVKYTGSQNQLASSSGNHKYKYQISWQSWSILVLDRHVGGLTLISLISNDTFHFCTGARVRLKCCHIISKRVPDIKQVFAVFEHDLIQLWKCSLLVTPVSWTGNYMVHCLALYVLFQAFDWLVSVLPDEVALK